MKYLYGRSFIERLMLLGRPTRSKCYCPELVCKLISKWSLAGFRHLSNILWFVVAIATIVIVSCLTDFESPLINFSEYDNAFERLVSLSNAGYCASGFEFDSRSEPIFLLGIQQGTCSLIVCVQYPQANIKFQLQAVECPIFYNLYFL